MHTRDLLIVRHAKSSWASPGVEDFDRRLNQRGVDDGATMAHIYASQLPRPDRVLCSPARRTRDTLACLIPAWVDPRIVEYEESLYLADASTWLSWIRATPADCKVLLLMGHNPGLTDLTNQLADPRAGRLDNLPTLAVCHLQSPANWSEWGSVPAHTETILRPKTFRQEGSGDHHA